MEQVIYRVHKNGDTTILPVGMTHDTNPANWTDVYEPVRNVTSPTPELPACCTVTFERQQVIAGPARKAGPVDKLFITTILAVIAIVAASISALYGKSQFDLAEQIREGKYAPKSSQVAGKTVYAASEIERFYSLPSHQDQHLKLAGRDILVNGNLSGAEIDVLGNITFAGDLKSVWVHAPRGVIRAHNASGGWLDGDDVVITGTNTGPRPRISGYNFPHGIKGERIGKPPVPSSY